MLQCNFDLFFSYDGLNGGCAFWSANLVNAIANVNLRSCELTNPASFLKL